MGLAPMARRWDGGQVARDGRHPEVPATRVASGWTPPQMAGWRPPWVAPTADGAHPGWPLRTQMGARWRWPADGGRNERNRKKLAAGRQCSAGSIGMPLHWVVRGARLVTAALINQAARKHNKSSKFRNKASFSSVPQQSPSKRSARHASKGVSHACAGPSCHSLAVCKAGCR